jgi:hypothetical protein
VFAEAKGNGFDTKAMRVILRKRKKDAAERQEEEAIIDLYKLHWVWNEILLDYNKGASAFSLSIDISMS